MSNLQELAGIAAEFDPEQDVVTGNWFGTPCLKVQGKVFAAFGEGGMAFKLSGEGLAQAWQVEGARPFDLHGKGRPMKNWVTIPTKQSLHWPRFARRACEYVAGYAQAVKEEITSGLVEKRQIIIELASTLTAEQQDEVFLGVWSVKDLMAHLIGWDYTNLEAVKNILEDRKPGFWDFYDRDWQTYNAQLVKKYRRDNFDELAAATKASHRELLAYLKNLPANTYIKNKKILTLLRAEIKDEAVHCEQIALFKEQCVAR